MKTRLTALMLLGIPLVPAGIVAGGDAKAELKKFEGTWEVESFRERGKDAPASEIKNMTFFFSGNKITFRRGKDKTEGTFKIDPGKNPHTLTRRSRTRRGRGSTSSRAAS
jgi:uncharacterized protein (TIGR03067 family)